LKRLPLYAIVFCIAAPLAASAAQVSPQTSGFPGDVGRLLDGVPLPDDQKPPRPKFPARADGPSMDLALAAARAAVKACDGYSIAVSIVDSAGMPKLFYVPDTTAGFHAYTALRKANTARVFDKPTSAVAALAKDDSAIAARVRGDGNLLAFAGGVPLWSRDQLIGAIGVSGAEPSSVDERCALAAAEVIEDQLN
jgi:uncharacterized protein GlcG (DUF336 family)